MDALEVAQLARDMALARTPGQLAGLFLRAALAEIGLMHGVGYWRDAAAETLQPLACTQGAVADWPAIQMEEWDNPLVYSFVRTKPCYVGRIGALVQVGESFERLRAHLPVEAALLALPVCDDQQLPAGVLVMVGDPAALRGWHESALGQALLQLYDGINARLQQAGGAARDQRSMQRRQEAERGHVHATRLLAGGFVGISPAARDLRNTMLQLAESSLSLLITGETGSGKDHAAWLIHQASPRAGRFVAVNCAAIPKDLIEAELFGVVRGAYTGATQARTGLVAEAHRGALFLDEIGDMPLPLQGALLRLLNEKKYRPVGATREQESDFRLICATHRSLPQLIGDGHFREDLYFRIRQQSLHLPPLRERVEDIPALVAHMLLHHNRERQSNVMGMSERAMARLQGYRFAGNVRELRSLVLAAAEQTASGAVIQAALVNSLIEKAPAPSRQEDGRDAIRQLWQTDDLPTALTTFERLLVDDRLRKACGSRRQAAQSLGIPKRTLARKCQLWKGSTS